MRSTSMRRVLLALLLTLGVFIVHPQTQSCSAGTLNCGSLFEGSAAFPQFFDLNGNPLSSGSLSFFVSGTTTPQAVYSDFALTTPLTNPVVLSAAGRSVVVYLQAAAYKVVLKDSGGVTLATADPVFSVSYLTTLVQSPIVQTITNTGTLNDLALTTTTAPVVIVRANNATDLTITGMTFSVNGQHVIVKSVGAGNVFFENQNGGSLAADRLINNVTSAKTPLAPGTGSAEYIRDNTTNRWRLITHEQGAWITPAVVGGFICTGALGWTVGAGDITTLRYYLKGSALTVAWFFTSTDVAAPCAGLFIPNSNYGSFTASSAMVTAQRYVDNGGAAAIGSAQTGVATNTDIELRTLTEGNWAASAGATAVKGVITFQVQD